MTPIIDISTLESHLWEAANILRGSPVDRTDWKSYILPLLFFKRICDVRDDEYQEVVETAYPFTNDENDGLSNIIRFLIIPGYPATREGQIKMLGDVMTIIRAVPNGYGLGIFYWDATWTAVPGTGWDPADAISGNG